MAELVEDILDDSSGNSDTDSEGFDSREVIPVNIMDETETVERPATPKSTTSTASTSTSSSSSVPSTTTDISSSSSTVTSLLSRLHRPTSSELSRKRKVDRNPPPKGKKRSRGASASDPKSVTPSQRIRQYAGENLSVSNKKLFCLACREELSVKSSVINYHIKSTKHISGKKRLETQRKAELEIVESLRSRDALEHPKGESLPDNQRVYRVKVVRTFLSAGVALNKIPEFRDLLEEHAFRLTDRRRMSDLVPFILDQEKEKIKNEIADKPLSIIFDGTSRLGELLGVVVRFIDSGWCIQQKLIRLKMLAKSLTGDEIARELINTLSVDYGVKSENVVAIMHDCASANNAAMRTLKVLYPAVLGIGCFSHTLNRVGEKFNAPLVNDFTTYWVSLFSHSFKAQAIWKQQTGRTISSFSATRWWSKWEVMNQILELFGDIENFLKAPEEFSGNTRAKLLEYFATPQKRHGLKVELAAVIDVGKPFVQATYKLEGDGPVAIECYEIISSLSVSVRMENYPNVQAIVKSIANGKTDVQQRWMRYAKACIKPALDYYKEHLDADLMSIPMKAFKAARLFSPHILQRTKPECTALTSLLAFPFITESTLAALKEEFPRYAAIAEDISNECTVLDFWKNNSKSLPKWGEAASQALLCQPSSAAAERVFSIVKQSFGDLQFNTLEDYLETSIILQYNKANNV